MHVWELALLELMVVTSLTTSVPPLSKVQWRALGERRCPWRGQTTVARQGRRTELFLVFNWGGVGAGEVFYQLYHSLRGWCPILLIKVIVILTNKKDFIIVGDLVLRKGITH